MSYQILNPVRHSLIGWFSKKSYKYGGVSVRECDDFDRETFGAEFRICGPYQPEYRSTEDGIQNNPMYWSRPARAYENGVQIWEYDENDENGKWVKLRGQLVIKGAEYYENVGIFN